MSVLDELVKAARKRASGFAMQEPSPRAKEASRLDDALRGKGRLKVIAEYKQSSPGEGAIRQDLAPVHQVGRYVRGGARAISVLTEPTRFGGDLAHLEAVARAYSVPVIMKDFVVEEAQVRMAAALGAAGVLLIVRCLSRARLSELAEAIWSYNMTPLVECHTEDEVGAAMEIPYAVIGVNNRDLDTLKIERGQALRLLAQVPMDRIVVAESGYESPEQTVALRGAVDAVLIGSALMRNGDPEGFLREVSQ